MRKLRTFWHVLRHSLIPLDSYYHKVKTTRFGFSLTYFVALVAAIVFITTGVKTAMFVTQYPPERLSSLIHELEMAYPEDLVIHINDMGRLSTTYDKPFLLFSPLDENPQPLVAIDVTAQRDKIFEYDSQVLLTERYMVLRSGGQLYTLHYQLDTPVRIDKSSMLSISQNADAVLSSYWTWLAAAVIAILLIAPMVVVVTQLITLIIISAVTYIIALLVLRKASMSFMKILQVSLHTVTAPLLVQSFLFLSGGGISIPYWYIVVNYIFLAGGLYEAYFESTGRRRK